MPQNLILDATAAEDSASPMPRAMLVFAHPDDETVALGARLGRFRPALLVHVTDGAPRNEQDSRAKGFPLLDDYRRAREEELTQALAMAGLRDLRCARLAIPDQEASLRLPWLVRQLAKLLVEQQPEVLFTHPYEGGHPDHDACAFAVHRAVALLRGRGRPTPAIIEAPFYHAGRNGIEAGCFPATDEEPVQAEYTLREDEQRRKQALLACFTTQRETLRNFPLAYERFRLAPRYDFSQPPPGPVLYDYFPWGMTSGLFCELARAAQEETQEAARLCR